MQTSHKLGSNYLSTGSARTVYSASQLKTRSEISSTNRLREVRTADPIVCCHWACIMDSAGI